MEDYADRILTAIFRFTVDPKRTADGHGHKLLFLPNLSRDLAEQGLPLKLPAAQLDEAIMEAATAIPHQRPLFEYLLPCWKRVVRALKAFRGPAPEKEELLREARRLCFSNCIFALTVPELFW
jgi:ubiquitin conjugation factor E4 B